MKFFNDITKKMAASGCEEEIRSYIKECLSGYEIFTDVHGSLIAHKKGKGDAKMLITSLDVPSLFVTHVEKDGMARFCSNGVAKEVLKGAKVRFCDGAKGVVNVSDGDEITDMYVDSGNKKDIRESEPMMIDSEIEKIGTMLSGFSVGNYACMRSVIDAANMIEDTNLYVVFLAKTARVKPSCGFIKDIESIKEVYIIDKSGADDTPGESEAKIKLGAGAVVRVMDRSMIASKRLLDKAISVSNDIKIQREVSDKVTNAAYVHAEFCGVEGICFGIPTRYMGQLCESVSPSDIGKLTKLIIRNLEV